MTNSAQRPRFHPIIILSIIKLLVCFTYIHFHLDYICHVFICHWCYIEHATSATIEKNDFILWHLQGLRSHRSGKKQKNLVLPSPQEVPRLHHKLAQKRTADSNITQAKFIQRFLISEWMSWNATCSDPFCLRQLKPETISRTKKMILLLSSYKSANSTATRFSVLSWKLTSKMSRAIFIK